MLFAELHLEVEKFPSTTNLFEGGRRYGRNGTSRRKNHNTMHAIATWNPSRDLDELQHRINSAIGLPTFRKDGERGLVATEWAPAVDITEDDREYLIKAELPELKKEDVKVTVENGILSITGERKFEKEEKGKKYHRIERSYGTFTRSFGLPEDADTEKVEAKFSDGVLHVQVAKSEAAKPKHIEVKVA